MVRLANLASLTLLLYQYWVLGLGIRLLCEEPWPGVFAFLGCACVAKAVHTTRLQLIHLLTR